MAESNSFKGPQGTVFFTSADPAILKRGHVSIQRERYSTKEGIFNSWGISVPVEDLRSFLDAHDSRGTPTQDETATHAHTGSCVAEQCFPGITDVEYETLTHYFVQAGGAGCMAHRHKPPPCRTCLHAEEIIENHTK